MNDRLVEYLGHMKTAASDACAFVEGMSKEEFLADKRTQQAAIMSLVIIGEAATRLMEHYSGFIDRHPDVPWRSMRGMRNRVAHGYFEINMDVVWDTVRMALPDLLEKLDVIGELHQDEGADESSQ